MPESELVVGHAADEFDAPLESETVTQSRQLDTVPAGGKYDGALGVVGWLLQEVTARFPGRGLSLDVASVTALLRETETRHGQYEPTAPKHHWSDWYAAYIVARVQGRTAEQAAEDGTLRVERTLDRVPA